MVYRFVTRGIPIPIAGTAIPHGLLATPDEFWFSPESAAAATTVFFSTVPVDATNVNITCNTITGTASVFARNALAIMK